MMIVAVIHFVHKVSIFLLLQLKATVTNNRDVLNIEGKGKVI